MPLHRIGNKIILFLHVPKTGGTTIEAWLHVLGPVAFANHVKGQGPQKREGLWITPQHIHALLLQRLIPQDFYDDAFCIVRDPFERLLSEYHWRNRGNTNPLKGIHSVFPKIYEEKLQSLHFRKWIKSYFSNFRTDQLVLDNHIRPQSDFLDVAKCRVYRFEDGLDTIMADLAARWDVPPPDLTPHENATRKIPFEIDLATRRRIDAFYAEDFERLGYPTAVSRA